MRRSFCALALPMLTLAAIGCSDDDPVSPDTYDYTGILVDYTNHVILGTYGDLEDKAAALNEAVSAFSADPGNQAKLDAAAQAWVAARSPWESSEAFLFGPVGFLSLDPSLDSWPVDRQQLESVLASNLELTPESLSTGLDFSLRGFHTIEFLLFRDGQPRTAGDVTTREGEYLAAASEVLASDAAALYEAWNDSYAGGSSYAERFKNAGESGSPYFSQDDAALEIVEGMIAICDEVANGKIADPYDEQDATLVESQFSWNSLTDFQDNLRSVQNAYNGGYHHGTDGIGIDVFVASRDTALDARVKAEIAAAIEAVGAIPHPFRDNLSASQEIEAAQSAIEKVRVTLEDDVKPMLSE